MELFKNDSDGDGVADNLDICDATKSGDVVDMNGCSQAQFCGQFNPKSFQGAVMCNKADWLNDEPRLAKDCKVIKKKCVIHR